MKNFEAEIPVPQKKTDKPKEKRMEISVILTECRSALQKYGLVELVNTAKEKKFESPHVDQERLCAGIIKLGEALTFCRDNRISVIKKSGISFAAQGLADLRSYFVHHHWYHQFYESTTMVNEKLGKILFIEALDKQLAALETEANKEGLKLLSKPLGEGENEYPFKYEVFCKCLQREFKLLNERMEKVGDKKELSLEEQIFLNNRVRNIFCIMMDMTNDNPNNTNVEGKCEKLKTQVEEFNKNFVAENREFFDFFEELKVRRNALSHLDPTLKAPFENDVELIQLIQTRLQGLENRGYLNGLEKICIPRLEIRKPLAPREQRKGVVEEQSEKRQREDSPEKNLTDASKLSSSPRTSEYNEETPKEREEAKGGSEESKAGKHSEEKKQKPSSPGSFGMRRK